ncbi:MAG: DUF3153 domain-containing protein [Cyanobium sp. M30B3]|nr:MAG: DUF3153 domain-containing protein [Cyanobium sp. M30B3]
MQIRAELHFGAPGRLQLVEELSPPPGHPASGWQRQFSAALRQLGLRPAAAGPGHERLAGPMQPANATLALLAESLQEAGRLAGAEIPGPALRWQERNWLVGVRQELDLELDLRAVEALPGLAASVDLQPLRLRAVGLASPEAVQPLEGGVQAGVRWRLRPGSVNRLQLHCWRWSPLGLGAVAVALLLAMVLVLASLRQRLGFGWPQLPA